MDTAVIVKNTRLFLLDMDGTIYLGTKWIDGAREFLEQVKASGRRFAFLTNNASRSARDYSDKLCAMGLRITPRDVVTSGEVTAKYLAEHFAGKRIFVLGTPALKKELAENGVILASHGADAAVVSFHTSLTYAELRDICDLVRAGVPYIATHPDLNCPTENGFIPDAGANIAFIKASAGREPDVVIGKPSERIVEYALQKYGASRDETLVAGDRIYTDIECANRAGVRSVLVFSGETTPEQLAQSATKPTLTAGSLAELTPFFGTI